MVSEASAHCCCYFGSVEAQDVMVRRLVHSMEIQVPLTRTPSRVPTTFKENNLQNTDPLRTFRIQLQQLFNTKETNQKAIQHCKMNVSRTH